MSTVIPLTDSRAAGAPHAPAGATAGIRSPSITWPHLVIMAVIPLVLVITLQFAGNAFTSDYGGFPDEPAHFVTSLMVHDFLLSAEWSNPLKFARTFYAHYPKVALGHWPPMFHTLLGVWMIFCGTSPLAVMLFISLITTMAAWLLGVITARRFGTFWGLGGAILFVSLPIVQQYAAMVMMESLMTLWILAAIVIYAQYLKQPRMSWATLFGLIASVAILTKASAFALAAVPPLAVIFLGRFHLLRRFSFWLPALIVTALCLPWYLLMLKLRQQGMIQMVQAEPSLALMAESLESYLSFSLQIFGVALAFMALLGIVLPLVRAERHRATTRPLWAAAGAGLLGILAVLVIIPITPDPRHLIPAAPLVILFVIRGIDDLARRLTKTTQAHAFCICSLVAIVAAAYLIETARIPHKRSAGFEPAVETVLSRVGSVENAILVSSNSAGEGVAVAEIARRDDRPGHIVCRASKLLSASRWDGSNYKTITSDADEILKLLDQHRVKWILLDDTTPDYPQYRHHFALTEAIESRPDQFSLAESFELIGQNPVRKGTLQLYRVTTDATP